MRSPAVAIAVFALTGFVQTGDPVFSGPQVGEKLTPFKALAFTGAAAGKQSELLTDPKETPRILVFVHEITRPALQFFRPIDQYASKLAGDGLETHFVWLTADKAKTEQYLQNAKQSLALTSPIVISLDGLEGPGNYGLNRKVAVTVLMAKGNRVVANFAIVQPNETDAPKVITAIAKLMGKPLPPTEATPAKAKERPKAAARPESQLSMRAPDFETQVLPVLTRAGCNAGSCHGAAIGRGGFRLSLFGYAPEADFESLVMEFKGRRVNLAHPAQSLVLRKPSGQIAHEGGIKLGIAGEGFDLLQKWIEAGAPRDARRRLEKLEVTPAKKLLADIDDKFDLKVVATFSDGAKEDVTRWSVLTPADPAALGVSSKGEVTALRRGRHALMVRFLSEVGCASVTVPLHAQAQPIGDWPRANFIDDQVNETLKELHLRPSPRAGDLVFLRRVFLDLIGTLPEAKDVEIFLQDQRLDKRARLVDALMNRQEFVDYWAYQWGDLFRIESDRLQPAGAAAFHQWVRDQVAGNTPFDTMASAMLVAVGDGHKQGAVNFGRVPGDALAHAEFVSQVFLGVRLQCANCHNHPLDRWTQDDYHGLAAVFARLSRGRNITVKASGEVIHPQTGQAAVPRVPGGPPLRLDGDPRKELASWLTAADNPFFAKAVVNRLWKALMGRGLVEPIDDHRATNPATHPELLAALAADFVKNGFDTRHTLRLIVASEAYQRSSLSTPNNKCDDCFYSHAFVRPLPPVVLVDAVAQVTGLPEKLGDMPLGMRAITLGDSKVASAPLDLLGRCSRSADCVSSGGPGSLTLALHKINGDWLNKKVADPNGTLHSLLGAKKSNAAIIAHFYQIALSRPPSAQEADHWQQRLAAVPAAERIAALEDFLWALLNSVEFGCNH
jgi:Protein of unknown function (DUF1549)/Protein of unknown function (DUF1553)